MRMIPALLVVSLAAACADPDADDVGLEVLEPEESVYALLHEGAALDASAAERLEEQLEETPWDLGIRARLLGYYDGRLLREDAEATLRVVRQWMWLLENAPWSELAGLPGVAVELLPRKEAEILMGSWLEQVERHDDVRVLWNAARFAGAIDRALALELLQRGREADPEDPRWAREIAHALSLEAGRACDDGGVIAAKSLAAYEDALALSRLEYEHFALLPDVAAAAVEANSLGPAKWYAHEMLAMADTFEGDWNYGNALHDGHAVLGLVALREGDLSAASASLIRAGQAPGSPQLDSFGPDLELANALLKAGQRDAVIAYLHGINRFWYRHDQIERWIAAIERGGTPELDRFR